MRDWNLTKLLWAGNAMVWPLLGLVLVYQFGWFSGGSALPSVQPLTPQPIRASVATGDRLARNPFDPDGNHWRTAVVAAAQPAAELRGVVLLPGVRAMMSGNGLVHVGEQLAGGRVTRIDADKVVVQRDGQTVELELARANRITLEGLNRKARAEGPRPGEADR